MPESIIDRVEHYDVNVTSTEGLVTTGPVNQSAVTASKWPH